MFDPTPKYRAMTRDPIDQVPMYWNVHPDGLPTRAGDTPEVVDRRLLDQAGAVYFHRSRVFDIPEEEAAYNEVMDWLANGGGVLRFEKDLPRADHNGLRVWAAWVEVRGHIPSPPGRGGPAAAPPAAPPRPSAYGAVTILSPTPTVR